MLSEVFMVDDSPNVLVRVGVFPEVSEKVGHGWCRYACAPATVQFRLDGSQVITTDIKLRRSEFEGISLAYLGLMILQTKARSPLIHAALAE